MRGATRTCSMSMLSLFNFNYENFKNLIEKSLVAALASQMGYPPK